MIHSRELHRHTPIRVEWPPSINLTGRLCTHSAALVNLSNDTRFTDAERERIEKANKLLMEVLTQVALRGV